MAGCRQDNTQTDKAKGFLNRRFKRRFAYFPAEGKVGRRRQNKVSNRYRVSTTHKYEKKKIPCRGQSVLHRGALIYTVMLDSAGNFTGTQTPGTNVHMAGGTVHDRLHALDIGLPRAVGTSVGVGDLDPEGNTLVAELTFSHPLHLLAVHRSLGRQKHRLI